MANLKKSGSRQPAKSTTTVSKKQDTCVYSLLDNKKKVYIGTTNDLDRREKEHRDCGKEFTSVKKESRNMTPESAKEREFEKLETYRKNHNGKNPKYNKDNDG